MNFFIFFTVNNFLTGDANIEGEGKISYRYSKTFNQEKCYVENSKTELDVPILDVVPLISIEFLFQLFKNIITKKREIFKRRVS